MVAPPVAPVVALSAERFEKGFGVRGTVGALVLGLAGIGQK